MADLIRLSDFRNGYISLVDYIKRNGRETSPRGIDTLECSDLVVELADPRNAIPIGVGRGLVKGIGVVESMHLLAGVSSLAQLNAVTAGRFSNFSDDGFVVSGAYGPRIYAGLEDAVRRLAKDPDSRQAAVSIWQGAEATSKDLPCTLNLVFSIEDGRLNMSTFMRSNDAWLGSPYDFWMFTQLQAAVAWALDKELGRYTHHAVSWHLYTRDLLALEKLERTGDVPVASPKMFVEGFTDLPVFDVGDPEANAMYRWHLLRDTALQVVYGYKAGDKLTGAVWYQENMPPLGDGARFNPADRYFRLPDPS